MIPEEATKWIGKGDPPRIFELKREIQKMCRSCGYRNPIYWDE